MTDKPHDEQRESDYRRALQEIATGSIAGEPTNHADTLAVCRKIASDVLARHPHPGDEPRQFRNG